MSSNETEIRRLGRARWRVALPLTAIIIAGYFAFMLLVANAREWMGTQIVGGLSRGIVLGVAIILLSWLLIFIYVQWANRVYDPQMKRLREEER